jgi:hypothetical protein
MEFFLFLREMDWFYDLAKSDDDARWHGHDWFLVGGGKLNSGVTAHASRRRAVPSTSRVDAHSQGGEDGGESGCSDFRPGNNWGHLRTDCPNSPDRTVEGRCSLC